MPGVGGRDEALGDIAPFPGPGRASFGRFDLRLRPAGDAVGLRGEDRQSTWWITAGSVSFLLALLSKEVAVAAPLAWLLISRKKIIN